LNIIKLFFKLFLIKTYEFLLVGKTYIIYEINIIAVDVLYNIRTMYFFIFIHGKRIIHILKYTRKDIRKRYDAHIEVV
jgi:hypothetical protein